MKEWKAIEAKLVLSTLDTIVLDKRHLCKELERRLNIQDRKQTDIMNSSLLHFNCFCLH